MLLLKNGPWIIDRSILTLGQISGDEKPFELNMPRISFRVQANKLPLKMRSPSMATKTGNILGHFKEVDQRGSHKLGRFFRINVSLDLRKPRMRNVNMPSGDVELLVWGPARGNWKLSSLLTLSLQKYRVSNICKEIIGVEKLLQIHYVEGDSRGH